MHMQLGFIIAIWSLVYQNDYLRTECLYSKLVWNKRSKYFNLRENNYGVLLNSIQCQFVLHTQLVKEPMLPYKRLKPYVLHKPQRSKDRISATTETQTIWIWIYSTFFEIFLYLYLIKYFFIGMHNVLYCEFKKVMRSLSSPKTGIYRYDSQFKSLHFPLIPFSKEFSTEIVGKSMLDDKAVISEPNAKLLVNSSNMATIA